MTKVLRFTVDNFDSFLMSRDNIKLIHLIRDPRAIINSRIGANFFPTKDVLSIAEVLCNKMLHDYQAGRKLLIQYPKRFRFVYYEDLTDNPLNKIKALYRYLGFSLDETKYSRVVNIKTLGSSNNKTQRQRNTAFWWRMKMDWTLIKQIDHLCYNVYDVLGYTAFSTNDELLNLTFRSVKIPEEYALL